MTAPLKGIHHSAYRCRDAEETRAFYEDVLGLKLAGLVIEEREPGTRAKNPFVHIFFALGDGNYLAFFDAPGTAKPEDFNLVHGFDRHVAFEAADLATLKAWQDKLNAAGVPVLRADRPWFRPVGLFQRPQRPAAGNHDAGRAP